jgi:hypothetical protein
MLSLNDAKGIARARFFQEGLWKWDNWILNIVSGWILVALIVGVVLLFTCMPNTPQLMYVIPQSAFEQGEDISVMYQWNSGYTVNGYLLTMAGDSEPIKPLKAMGLWLFGILVFLPMIGMCIYTAVRDAMLTRYIDNFTSAWAVKKELPE